MSINRKLIRENFLKMLEDDKKEKEKQQRQEEEQKQELMNQERESKLMTKEETLQKKFAFYKKMGVNKPDMQVEFWYTCQDDPTCYQDDYNYLRYNYQPNDDS